MFACSHLPYAFKQSPFRGGYEHPGLRVKVPNPQGNSCIPLKPFVNHSKIQAHDVAFAQPSLGAGYPVNHLFIYRHAQGRGKAIVPFERRDGSPLPRVLFGNLVQFGGRHARSYLASQEHECVGNYSACLTHLCYLFTCLDDYSHYPSASDRRLWMHRSSYLMNPS